MTAKTRVLLTMLACGEHAASGCSNAPIGGWTPIGAAQPTCAEQEGQTHD